MTPLRIIQVGMGGFGRSWASVVMPQVEHVELVACVDVNPASIEATRALVTLPEDAYFLSLEEALEHIDADAVLVTTIVQAHVPAATTALSSGKHVLVEKPFAASLDEARGAVKLAAEMGLVLMVSQNYRHFPAPRAVQTIVERGELGALSNVEVDFRKYDNELPRGERLHYLVPQPLLIDMAIHHFDLMRAVLKREAREIYCRSWNPPWSKYDEPTVGMATIRFDGDVMVSYRGSWVSPGPETAWSGAWRMDFADGEVSWTSRAGGTQLDEADYVSVRPLGAAERSIVLPEVPYLDRAGSLRAFYRAIRTGEEPETSGRDNLHTLALTTAAVESAASGQPVLL